MQLFINLQKLEYHARRHKHLTGNLCAVKVTQLGGGFVAQGVYRLDLWFEKHNGHIQTASYVQKYSSAAEVQVMQTLSELPAVEAIPECIDCSCPTVSADEPYAHWFVTPFYEGEAISFEDEVPLSVIRSLAQLHAFFRSRVQSIDYLHRVDSAFFQRTFAYALNSLVKAQQERPNPIFEEAHRQLAAVSKNAQLYQALAALPLTLTHGDVHPGNILCSPDGSAVLIDWGNARIAPAMLDIANMIQLGSAAWEDYLAALETASGEPVNMALAHLGYHWATIMVNTQYLPYAVDNTPVENVEQMVGNVVDAQKKIAELSSA